MAIMVSSELEWTGNSWITRTFFREALPFLQAAPELRDTLEYCVNSEIDGIDLSAQPASVHKGLARLVTAVLMFHERTHGSHFDEPEYFDDYINSLKQLKRLLHTHLGIP